MLRVGSALPGRPALSGTGSKTLTYKQVSDLLLDSEPTQGTAIVVADNSLESVCAYLYALAKYKVVLLIAQSEALVLGDLLASWNPHALLSSRQERLGHNTAHRRSFWAVTFFEHEITGAHRDNTSSNNQLLLGTSGSTGGKKFVRLNSDAVAENALAIASALDMDESDRTASILPISYSYGLSVLNSTLVSGGQFSALPVNFLSKKDSGILRESGITQIQGVPSTFSLYSKLGLLSSPPKSVKLFTQAGGKMAADEVLSHANVLRDSGVGLSVMYGQTEATARMSIMPHEMTFDFPQKAGFAVPGSRFIHTRDHPDELIFEGPGVMLGYAETENDLQKDDECNGILHTGDLGFVDGGLVEITGRKSRIAKVEGVRYSLDFLDSIFSKRGRCVTLEVSGVIHVFAEAKDVSPAELVKIEPRLRERNLKIWNNSTIPMSNSGKIEFSKLESLL